MTRKKGPLHAASKNRMTEKHKHKHKLALECRAWREAAYWIEQGCDSCELPEDLNMVDEAFMREFMRNDIASFLRRLGGGV